MKQKTRWNEKLHDAKDLPKIVVLKKEAQIHWHAKTMVVPAPIEVNEIMAKVTKGKLITIDLIRQKLARKHHCDIGCPLTTGIFSWIAANAAAEEKRNKMAYWRTLKTGGEINPKYPGGIEAQKKLLEKEGHKVIAKGKRYFVEDFERKLVKL